MTNIVNFNKVIADIKENPTHFDMSRWYGCGTVMCIGGTAARIILKEKGLTFVSADDIREVTQYVVAEWLGIDTHSGDHLFFMHSHTSWCRYGLYSQVTPENAIAVLEEVRDTGHCRGQVWARHAPQAVDLFMLSLAEKDDEPYEQN